jgi:GLPGLI family protein
MIRRSLIAILFVFCGLFPFKLVQSQETPTFVLSGKIEFERKENFAAWIPENTLFSKSEAIIQTANFVFTFGGKKSLYKMGVQNQSFMSASDEKTVYIDYASRNIISLKTIIDNTYLLNGTLRNIQWKMTSDTREIAGYDCRKATAVVMDSLYVVAFYSDKIMISGGPESFTGLPGMILGLAIPRLHTTWFATKVTPGVIKESEIVPPVKNKTTSPEELNKLIDQLRERIKPMSKGMSVPEHFVWQVLL